MGGNAFLPMLVMVMIFVVVIGYINERTLKLTYEIALMLFSIVIGAVFYLIYQGTQNLEIGDALQRIMKFDLDEFLTKGVLCFMLFAGSCHMRLKDFAKQKRPITVLSIVATLLGAVFYGVCFYLVSLALHLGLTMPVCLMFGSIVAPTDPIAATSILNKFRLPKNISFLIEGESLLNDGVGVALFVCFSGMVRASGKENFFLVMFREIFGAVLVGGVVTILCFFVFYKTKNEIRQIFTSILAVSLSYVLCEYFDFSGAIASVVCGVLYSSLRHYFERKGKEWHLEKFDVFWEVTDNLLNSILYVILGLTFLHILAMPAVILISLLAILCNFIGRGGSLAVSTLMLGPIPDGFDRWSFIKLLTWGGLRGGLCIALAMSAKPLLPDDTENIVVGATYAIVAFTTIVQGLTMRKVYAGIQKSLEKKKLTGAS